jgi:fibronectin type III domain protein
MWRPKYNLASWSMLLAATLSALPGCSGSPQQPPAADSGARGGRLTVSWTPPERNTDGTPLIGLTGYTIRYGPAPGNYTGVVRIEDPAVTRYVIRGLRPGRWYFAVSANNVAGGHSELSAEVSATVK